MTPKEKAEYLKTICNNDINCCFRICDRLIKADVTPEFYEKVKIELKDLTLLTKINLENQN